MILTLRLLIMRICTIFRRGTLPEDQEYYECQKELNEELHESYCQVRLKTGYHLMIWSTMNAGRN